MIVLEPSSQFLSKLYEAIDRLSDAGGITEDEATILRTDIFYKREAVKDTQGDAESITNDTVASLKEKLKSQYEGSARTESDANYKKYLAQRKENIENRRKAAAEIERVGEDVYNTYINHHENAWKIVRIILLMFVIESVISGIVWRSAWSFVMAVITGIFTLLGAWDSLSVRRQFVSQHIKKNAKEKADLAMDKKRDEYETILGKLSDIETIDYIGDMRSHV